MAEVTTIQIRGQDKTAAAFSSVNKSLKKFDKNASMAGGSAGILSGGLSKIGGALGPLVGIAGIGMLTKKLFDFGDRLGKVSTQIGISVEDLQGLQFAASQSGVGQDQLNSALQKFSINIGHAEAGTKLQKDAFETLGVSIRDSGGGIKDTNQLFKDVADAMSGIEEPATKAKLASELFGKTGVELLALLNTGGGTIDDFSKKLRDAGGMIGGDTVKGVEKFNDQMDLVSRVAFANFAKVMTPILPVLSFLADNFDNIAKFVAIAGSAFLVAKIPAAIAAITIATKGLTLAMASNPFGLIAVGVTAFGTAAYAYSDEISEFFGFAGDKKVADNVGDTAKELGNTETELKDLEKIEAKRLKTANEFAGKQGTIKKALIPSLESLDKGLGTTKTKVTNLLGAEGLGGVQLGFTQFLTNLNLNVTQWLGDTQKDAKKEIDLIYQDFTEMITGLQNKLVFQRNDISDAFDAILFAFKSSIKSTKLEVEAIKIDVPASAFNFSGTTIKVPSSVFDWNSVETASGTLTRLVDKINGYRAGSRSVSRTANAVNTTGGVGARLWEPYWEGTEPTGSLYSGARDMTYDVPYISGGSGRTGGRSGGNGRTSPASAAADGGGGSTVVVNIYDGTGQEISAFDSAIRVEIEERADRYDEFSALTAK